MMPMWRDALTEITLGRAAKTLARRDGDLAAILERHGPPPLWARPPGFPTLVKIILEHQVSLFSAASMLTRLKKNIVPFHPARMIELGEVHLKSLGMTRQKTAYCLELAQSVTDRRLRLSQLSRMGDAQPKAALMEIKGLGAWSADVYLLMALRRPDIWPVNDLALAIAISKLKQIPNRPNPAQLIVMAAAWRPFRSVALRNSLPYSLAQRTET